MPPLPDRVRLSDFPEAYEQVREKTFVLEDDFEREGLSEDERANSKALGMRAIVASTARRGERNPLSSLVAVSARPRRWTHEEVALVEEAAERTWAAMERARAQAALRESEEQQAFQLHLSDALRAVTDPADVEAEATRLVAERLDVGWCYFNEFDERGTYACVLHDFHRNGLSSMAGVHDLSGERNFLDLVQSGAVLDMPDLARSEHFSAGAKAAYGVLGIRSALGAPLLRNGRLAAVLLVADTRVRAWSRGDAELMKGAAERTWAALQRARAETAVRESEERQAFLLKLSDAMRAEQDPAAVGQVAVDLMARHMGVDRCYVAHASPEGRGRVDPQYYRPELAPMPAEYEVDAEFPEAMRQLDSKPLIIHDLWNDPTLSEQDKSSIAALSMEALLVGALRKGQNFFWGLAVASATPRTWTDADRVLVEEAAERIWAAVERARAEAALRESEKRLHTLMEGIPQLVRRSGDKGLWTWSSPQWQAFTGQSPENSVGLGWLDCVHPDDRGAAMEAWGEAPRRGAIDVEYRIRRAVDGEYVWHHSRSLPVRDEGGRIVEWLGTTTDVQQLKAMQERQSVMVAELQHRTRNLIGVVRSIAGQTMALTGPTEAFRDEFNHRLEALSRVQGLLSRSDEEPITIEALIRMELEALGAKPEPNRVEVRGQAVRIRPSVVQTLALALHELATNARKYGALSNDAGKLDVRWRTYTDEKGSRLALEWTETGGQPPKAGGDARRGYGRELIEHALPYSLSARTIFEHDEASLRCTIDMPLERSRRQRNAA